MALLYGLTEDVTMEILSWLPPKSLIQCKCVSKSWNSFIGSLMENPYFVNKHLNHMPYTLVFRRSRLFHAYRRFNHDNPLSLLTIFHAGADHSDRIAFINEIIDIPRFEGRKEMGSVWLSYHCNGISCMVNSSKTVILCNLELREFKVVPETTYDLCQALIGNKKFNGLKRMGFGYDIRADVYKIVIIFSWYNNTNKGYTICAEVYDLTTNSWKDIKFMEGEAFDINYGWGAENKGVYCKGFYYWLVDSNFGRRILSFDMCNEVFRILPSLPNTRYKNVEIAVWNDSLALFIWCNNLRKWSKDPMSIEIWVMEEQSGEWCNVFSIGPFEDMWAPLTFWKRDELLMVTKDREIVSYNLGSKKLRKLDIHPDDRMHCWGFYVKSLVSVNQRRS